MDTLTIHRRLTKVGFGAEQADMLTEVIVYAASLVRREVAGAC